jgi:hypothetical protein
MGLFHIITTINQMCMDFQFPSPLPTLVKKPKRLMVPKQNHPNIKLASLERKKGGR